MEMSVEDFPNKVKCIALEGALDTEGASTIEIKMAAIAGHNDFIVIDMSKVAYLASLGISVLIRNAQAVKRRGGAFVICSPTAFVDDVLRKMVIQTIIPIFQTKEEAMSAVTTA